MLEFPNLGNYKKQIELRDFTANQNMLVHLNPLPHRIQSVHTFILRELTYHSQYLAKDVKLIIKEKISI